MTPIRNTLEDNIDANIHALQDTLTSEMATSVTQLIQAWNGEFNSLTTAFLTALDCGATPQDGELAVRGLPPKTWMRLTMATLGAIVTILDYFLIHSHSVVSYLRVLLPMTCFVLAFDFYLAPTT
ncbi:hypothetical protein EDB83DRAFT_2529048 [Lactarius deliciosus]|nr:hypothetical protein EDB83DRAFT_2529048 [Lactarius deliciosus]